MKKPWLIFWIVLWSLAGNAQSLMSGFRASRLLGNYPNNTFPTPQYWTSVGEQMSAKFDNSTPAAIWIVGLYQDNGYCSLSFPNPTGETYDHIYFSSYDKDEAYLMHFDTTGIKVFLQVESGDAEIGDLMDLVLGHYGTHSCVIGFGVDVEWYHTNLYSGGEPVSDSLSEAWEMKMKTFDSTYTLFLKHYTTNRMPPVYRGDILFVDDSQGFGFANNPLEYMVYEYGNWAATFAPNLSAFQFGYPGDQSWWSAFEDPPAHIGQALLDDIPSCGGLFWVDFTVTDVFPLGVKKPLSFEKKIRLTNPVQGLIRCQVIDFDKQKLKWSLQDLNAKIIATGERLINGNNDAFSISCGQLPPAYYVLHISVDGKQKSYKIFIR